MTRLPRLSLLTLLLAAAATPASAKTDLSDLSLEQLLEVTITGAAKYEQRQDEVAAAASVLTRAEIKAFGWRTLDEALNSLPGIYTTWDRQYSYLGTRGFSLPGDFNTRVLLTINGNRVNDVVYDSAIMGRGFPLDVDLIERIEYIPGPGGAVYGQNALFGVINVVTRTGAGVDGVELAAAYENLPAAWEGRATWGKRLDSGLDVLLSASGYRADGQDLALAYPGAVDSYPWVPESGVARGMDGARDQEFFARLAKGPWAFDFVYGDQRKDDPTAAYYSEPFAPGQYQGDRWLMAQLQYQESFADDTLHFTGRLFLGEEEYRGLLSYGTPDTHPYYMLASGDSAWQGAELRLLATGWTGHKLLMGVEYQHNSRRDQANEDLVDPALSLSIPGSGWRLGVYAQDEWTLGETLTATLGLRYDDNDLSGSAWSPRAALIWRAAPETSVKALYGRAFRAPNAFEKDYDDQMITQLANPELVAETVDTYELVLDHRPARDLLLRGSLYHWRMQDLITLGEVVVPGPDGDLLLTQYGNGEEVRATGAELSADKTWAWGGRLRGSLSWQDVAYASGGELDNSPRWLGKLNFSTPLSGMGLRLGYELQYSSARQTVDGGEVDGYWLSNLNLLADGWAEGLEVSLGLYNLFDTHYEQPAADHNWQTAFTQDGRSMRLKVAYHF